MSYNGREYSEVFMKLSEQKRLDILDAAEQLFYTHGVEHTSMDNVAKAASVSKRTVYNHFETKELLFFAIITRMKTSLETTDVIDYDDSLPIKAQLIHIAEKECELMSSAPFIRGAKIAFLQMLQQPDLAKQLSASKVGCQIYLENFLQTACRANKLKIDDMELAVSQFVFQLKSHIFYPRLYGFDVPDTAQTAYLVEQTVELFLARYQS